MIWGGKNSRCPAIATFAAASLLVSACAFGGSDDQSGVEATGTLGLELQVGSGVTLDSVTYSIEGNGFEKSGSFDVSSSTVIRGVIGGVPAGSGYTIALTASDDDGDLTCSGSTSFDVIAGVTTPATVHLTCKLAPNTGSVTVNGSVNVCPRIDSLSVSPAEAAVGHAVELTTTVTEIDEGPSPLTYSWTANDGLLTGADAAAASLTCTKPGDVVVTVTVSDGDCSDTSSAVVTCSPADSGS